jgi:hypothetical protein
MMGLLLLSRAAAAAGAQDGDGGAASCPATVQRDTCWVVATPLAPPQNLTKEGCCRACQVSATDPEATRCTAFQSNHAGNGWGQGNRTWAGGADCFEPSVTCCFLYARPSEVKQPKHPAQTQCDASTMPAPPAPPWPKTPPAGAKNVLYVLVDDLRTQMTPYGHSEMKTPHFSAFADTAVQFQQVRRHSAVVALPAVLCHLSRRLTLGWDRAAGCHRPTATHRCAFRRATAS